MTPFLFFQSWPLPLAVKYVKYLSDINSVINYFYLQSLPKQKHFSRFSTSEVKRIYERIYVSKLFYVFQS